jgi:hypothetical protein
MFNWSISEGILEASPLAKIKVPMAEKKVIKSLIPTEVSQLISRYIRLIICISFWAGFGLSSIINIIKTVYTRILAVPAPVSYK